MDTNTYVKLGELQKQGHLKFKPTTPMDVLEQLRSIGINKYSLDKINMKIDPICMQGLKPSQKKIQEKIIWVLSFVHSVNLEEVEFFKENFVTNSKILLTFAGINFHQLEYLNLNDCKIGNIEFLTFLDLPQLKRIILDKNDLINLNSFAKCTFPKLYWIDLIENYIIDAKGLHRSLLGPKLGVLDVSQKNQLKNTNIFTYLTQWFFKLPFQHINYIRKKQTPFLFRRIQRTKSLKKYPDISFR